MKRIFSFALIFPAICYCALAPVDEAGFQELVNSRKGKVVLYDFWATWCAPCRAEMPRLASLAAKLRPQGFELVTISSDEPEQAAAAEKFLKQAAAPAPYYLKHAHNDDRFINSIDAKWSGALPALFLYDKNGRKARSFIGETDLATLEAAIRKLL